MVNNLLRLQAVKLYWLDSVVVTVAANFVCFVEYAPRLMLFCFHRNKAMVEKMELTATKKLKFPHLPSLTCFEGAKILQEILYVTNRSLSYLLFVASADNSIFLEVQRE